MALAIVGGPIVVLGSEDRSALHDSMNDEMEEGPRQEEGQCRIECGLTLKNVIDQIVARRNRSRAKKDKQNQVRVDLFCSCGYGDGFMVHCDGEEKFCPGKNWYHLECVGLRCEPRGNWKCSACTQKASEDKKKRGCRKRSMYSSKNEIVLDESKFVLSKEDFKKKQLTPLKVEAAERQSRRDMVIR